ncbi:MAG: hypothetical protein ACR2MK_02275 [Solirubrobacteraceae bacterium]
MFHLELRQFPHVARAFNLEREELDARFARPWVSGSVIEHEDRRWTPDRARLTIFEGPALRPEEIGMGRGWATVGKTSEEVTETVLAQAQRGSEGRAAVETFKAGLLAAARTPVTFAEVMELAVAECPSWRASERLALAEQAVWELLHQGRLTLSGPDGAVESPRWQPTLIAWSTWIESGSGALLLEATG